MVVPVEVLAIVAIVEVSVLIVHVDNVVVVVLPVVELDEVG